MGRRAGTRLDDRPSRSALSHSGNRLSWHRKPSWSKYKCSEVSSSPLRLGRVPQLSGGSRDRGRVGQTTSRFRQFTDEQWERIEPLLPSNEGRQGHPFGDNRKIVEGIVYRYRAGIPWRDR